MTHRVLALALAATTLAAGGCYRTVVYEKPGLLDGALRKNPNLELIAADPSGVGGRAPVDMAWLPQSPAELDGTPDENDPLRLTMENGELILVRRSPAHLVHHMLNTIRQEEWDLLYDQLLADRLLTSYVQGGRDPRLALDYIKENRDAVVELLRAMPGGEQTPGVTMHVRGKGRFQLVRGGGYRADGKFWAMEVVIERGAVRLSMLHRRAPTNFRRF